MKADSSFIFWAAQGIRGTLHLTSYAVPSRNSYRIPPLTGLSSSVKPANTFCPLMTATASNESINKTKVDVIPFGNGPSNGDNEHHLSQIRSLFVDGMKINKSPEDYIQHSLQSDLNDASSMRDTYFSGRGTFLMLVEDEQDVATVVTDKDGCGDDQRGSSKRRPVKGIVGLQDLSSTGNGNEGTSNDNGEGLKKNPNLCELRRMSIHSSRRRVGYGAKLVQECISHAKQNKFDGIKLYTGGWMEAAIKFYTKMGFDDKGRLEYKNRDGSSVTIAHLEMIFDEGGH